jgi:hypothetical protein
MRPYHNQKYLQGKHKLKNIYEFLGRRKCGTANIFTFPERLDSSVPEVSNIITSQTFHGISSVIAVSSVQQTIYFGSHPATVAQILVNIDLYII